MLTQQPLRSAPLTSAGPNAMHDPDVTALLDRVRDGDAAAFNRLVAELYAELRRIAHQQRRRLGASDTVNTTAVVHEAYAKLGGRTANGAFDYTDRTHFFRVAARAMRDVIVDYRPNAGIRLAPHFYNTEAEIARAIEVMREIVASQPSNVGSQQ